MEEQAIKIKRSTFVVKVAMALVILVEAFAFYKTNTLDFGAIAMAIGVLALLRGLLLSPLMFNTPTKSWFKQNVGFNPDSYKYFALSFLLITVGFIKYL